MGSTSAAGEDPRDHAQHVDGDLGGRLEDEDDYQGEGPQEGPQGPLEMIQDLQAQVPDGRRYPRFLRLLRYRRAIRRPLLRLFQ